MKDLNSREIHDAIDQALAEVSRRLATGELDGSGRYWTDEELAAQAAVGAGPTSGAASAKPKKETAA